MNSTDWLSKGWKQLINKSSLFAPTMNEFFKGAVTTSKRDLWVDFKDWTLPVLACARWIIIGLGKHNFLIKHNAKGPHRLHMFHLGNGQGESNSWSHPGKTALESTPDSLCAVL